MKQKISHINKLNGTLSLPGDKSISHRAVMLASLAKGKSKVKNFLDSADIRSTINCFRSLGADIIEESNQLFIEGYGIKGFSKPKGSLNAGNSGTTARLISGILAAQLFDSTIIGDSSLSKRPMERIINPLTQMGADIKSANGYLPLMFNTSELHAVEYKLPVASAQVKSCVLLAGLHLNDTTRVIEPVQTRNHTELMLGLPVKKSSEGNIIEVNSSYYPQAREFIVPADISTAAFFIALALITPDAEIRIKNVLLNETRAGIIDVFRLMGGDITTENIKYISGEKSGDIIVRNSQLTNVELSEEIIPNIIDEIPILSVVGLFAEGVFQIKNAVELRAKESDRIQALVSNFMLLGCEVEETEDGFAILSKIKNHDDLVFESYGDHRIAMAFAVLASRLNHGAHINGFECVDISNPNFLSQLKEIVAD